MSLSNGITLTNLFSLEQVEEPRYQGQSWNLGFRALFGGQVLGQALMAAIKTIDTSRHCHSFHSYFLLPGDPSKPVIYDVENIRDGNSFSVRRIKAIQNERTIFYMTASFQIEENGLEHQHAVPPTDIPLPETLEPDIKRYEDNLHAIPKSLRDAIDYHRPIDIRTIPDEQFHVDKLTPQRGMWLKANEVFNSSVALNQAALAYASDYHLLTTSLKPHNVNPADKSLSLASIDHAMWFHQPFNFDEWLLYTSESTFSGGGRGFIRGQFFNQKGTLVATTTQEGLIRVKK